VTTETVLFNKAAVLKTLATQKMPPSATYPKGATLAELFLPQGTERESVPSLLLGAFEADIPVMLIGRPGVAKTAIVRFITEAMGADLIFIGKNAAPSSYVVPGMGRVITAEGEEVEFIDYIVEDRLKSDRPKVVLVDELARMDEGMRQQILPVFGPRPTIANFELRNVVGRVATGNRVEDGIDALEPALATRMFHIPVKASSVPWKYFVAADFPEVDLTELFRAHDRLSPDLREQLTPRKMRKIVWNLIHNGCAWPALAMADSDYEKLVDTSGTDRTAELLDQFAEVLGTPNRPTLSDPIEAVLDAVCEHGEVAYVEGAPGIGKTTLFEVKIPERRPNAQVLSISLANTAPEDWNMVMIQSGDLKRKLLRFFAEPGEEKYLILDEIWRAPDDVMDMVLEVLNERTVAGIPTGVRGIVALNNPRTVEGYTLDVGTPDTAQADRFTMSVSISAQQTQFRSYLLVKYPEVAEHFVNWWEGLSARDQVLYPPRVVEMAIRWYNQGLPLEFTKPWYDGMPLEISFLELERALADRPLVKIRDVAQRVEEFVQILSGSEGQTGEAHRSVFDAFDRSDVVQLREHRKVCERLMPLLSQQAKINLLRSEKAKRRFWLSVVNGETEELD
jgi:MoxR-like ATPase